MYSRFCSVPLTADDAERVRLVCEWSLPERRRLPRVANRAPYSCSAFAV